MKKLILIIATVAVCGFSVAGCAPQAYRAVDLNPQLQSGALVQKTDNFVVLFDGSASMDDLFRKEKRLARARETVRAMIATIPDIKVNAGLRKFWAEQTELIYGVKPLDKTAYVEAVDTVQRGSGRTPLGRTIAAAGNDLMNFPGRSALIIFSDFEEIPGVDDIRPESVLNNAVKIKNLYGDRLCIYPIQIGKVSHGKELAAKIAEIGKCGFAANAEELATPEAMASFVERVFLGPPAPAVKEEQPVAEREAVRETKAAAAPALENIHFDFDKSVLRPQDQEILKRHGEWLLKNSSYSVVIEGHCDERGTTEYNMALGDRRALEAKKFLINMGLEYKRIKTISYGEERPLDPGHTEKAWSQNRRDQFILEEFK